MKTKLQNKQPKTKSTRVRLQGSTLAIALFILFAVVARSRGNAPAPCDTSATGYLVVYSATDRLNDGDTPYYPHSSYGLYTTEGKLIKTIANHVSANDEVPERVMLPVGRYVIGARSEEKSFTKRCVIIRPSQTTIIDLESATVARPSVAGKPRASRAATVSFE